METTSIVARWRWREDRSLAALADEAGVPVAVVARLEEPDGPFRVDRESLVAVGAAMGLPEGPELVRGAGFEADARILEARLRSDTEGHRFPGGSGSSRSMGYGTSAYPAEDEDTPSGE
jgi:hypothetical protein